MKSDLEEIITHPDTQEAYYRLVAYYLDATAEEQANIRNQWDFGIRWKYPDWRRLACHINETHSPEEKIIALLTATSLGDLNVPDWRDEIIRLGIIYHSCILAKISPQTISDHVALASSPRTSGFLHDFSRRLPKDKSLEAFNLDIVMNSDGESEIHAPPLNKEMLDIIKKYGSPQEQEYVVNLESREDILEKRR